MARGLGANALANSVFETTYGITPGAGFFKLPFVSHSLGEEQPLINSDLLGLGREPQDPTYDVVTDDGDIVVPVDARNFGRMLKLAFGAPTSTGTATAATGSLTFSSQPSNNSTITLNGVVFTFVSATPTGNQILIGANLAATMTAVAAALNASGDVLVDIATYAATSTAINITFDTAGPAGNAFTLAASTSPASNGTASGATLSGGSVKTHTFTSGASALPSMSIEIGNPEVPSFTTNFGARLNQLKIALSRSGLLNATCSLICQGETAPAGATAMGSPTVLAVRRFAQAAGAITRDGVALASVVAAEFTFSNNLDKVETIRSDGRIEDVDPGMAMMSGSLTVRFADTALIAKATSKDPVALTFGWTFGDFSLTFTVPRVFLPKVKRPISGPAGIQAQFNWQASGANGASVTVALVNDVASY